MILTERLSTKKELPIGMIICLIISMLFMVRFTRIALSRNIIGNHAYVQMINSAIPILKGSYYDKDAYEESTVTIGSLLIETLYIDKVNPQYILSHQVVGFRSFISNNNLVINGERVNSYALKEESIEIKEEPKVDLNGVRNPNLVKTLDQSKPEVLLYSTHTTEAYTGDVQVDSTKAYNSDMNKNIIGVGALIEKELEEYYGISVIHDKTMYCTDFNNAYKKSRVGVQSYLEKYGDFKLIVDLHRDAGPTKERVTANINGENLAKLLFPTGKNNSNYNDTQELIKRMNNDIKEIFPELYRGVLERNRATSNSYNQDLSKNAVLIEVGADKNTVEEAMSTAKYVARLIAEEVSRKSN